MYRGQTEDVGQIRLRKGQPDRVILGHADRPLPPNGLAQDIGHTPARGAAPERDNALPQHGLLLHRTRRYGVRSRLPAGGRWIRTSGSAPAATPLTDRGVKPLATAAGCHFGGTTPVASAVNVNLLRRVALHEKLTQKHDRLCGLSI